jgi:subtilisin family serine protease
VCALDRCFPQAAIGWKPELRSCVSGMKIGIIDTAVDVAHPALRNRQIETGRFARTGKPGPNWHGTGVTALLAGDSDRGTPGLVPDAKFYVAEDDEPASDTLSLLRAFDWMERRQDHQHEHFRPPDALIEKAITKLSAKGILLVAAAGNDGPGAGPSYPAAYDQVIAVTAVNKNLQNYRYANRGSYIDIAAPGVAIWTALPGSQLRDAVCHRLTCCIISAHHRPQCQ